MDPEMMAWRLMGELPEFTKPKQTCGVEGYLEMLADGSAPGTWERLWSYTCTRPKGHKGPHVAHGNNPIGAWE